MARKTKAEAQETRGKILDAAIDVFLTKGVARASLEEIAETAGVTRGAVYWHFKNKRDIFQALHDQLHCFLLEEELSDMQNDHPDPLGQLEALCSDLLVDFSGDQQKKRTLSIFFLKCDYSGEMEVFLNRQEEERVAHIEWFTTWFEHAKSHGQLDESADPRTLSLSLMCYLTGIVYEYLRNTSIFDLDAQAPQLVRQFFNGIRYRP